MPFSRAPVRAPARPHVRVAVFAVGGRAYTVNAGGRSAHVTLTDDNERPLASLKEGAEVLILAWRPGWKGTTRYCVRMMDSGLEGWLPASELRRTKDAIPSLPAATLPAGTSPGVLPARESASSRRRFGQRFE
jgi:hypothetical protein